MDPVFPLFALTAAAGTAVVYQEAERRKQPAAETDARDHDDCSEPTYNCDYSFAGRWLLISAGSMAATDECTTVTGGW